MKKTLAIGLFLLIFLLGCTDPEDIEYPTELATNGEIQTQPEENRNTEVNTETNVQAQVIINGHILTTAELQALTQTYGK
ncbi:MAG: hypothetical protein WC595_04170, partial [Candidatus Nanoarchaeia archaeon]